MSKEISIEEALEELEHRIEVEELVLEDENFEHYENDDKFLKTLYKCKNVLVRVSRVLHEIEIRQKENTAFWGSTDLYSFLKEGKRVK